MKIEVEVLFYCGSMHEDSVVIDLIEVENKVGNQNILGIGISKS